MDEMSPRERVTTALNHKEPDRVPVALGGGPYGIVDELYFELLEFLNLGKPVSPFRTGHNITYLDDRVMGRLDVDTRYVWPGESPSSPQTPTDDPDLFLDGFGQPWRRSFPYWHAVDGILAGRDIDDIESVVTWPDPQDPKWIVGVRERAKHLKEETDYYVIARMMTSHGPYMTSAHLRGTENLLLDMAVNPDYVEALVARVTDFLDALLGNYMDACGEYIDLIELPGDDYASSENLMMSPAMFRRFIKPALKRLVATIREKRSSIRVMLHSDGMIEPLLSDFIELGIDVLHPLEPIKALDHARIKKEYGDRLAFLGGVDITKALPGTEEDVVREVKRCIGQLGPGGGYILAPSNHIQSDVSPQNVKALFDSAREYGQYPIRDCDH
jgi:uroporphyrinogen decarboxylase